MNVLQLSVIAQAYYERLRNNSLAHGGEKYVVTNGKQCLFVESDYEPKEGEAVFFLAVRNRNVACTLHKSNNNE